jgi:hypothetical protein
VNAFAVLPFAVVFLIVRRDVRARDRSAFGLGVDHVNARALHFGLSIVV